MKKDHPKLECSAPECGVDQLERIEFRGMTSEGPLTLVLQDRPHEDPLAVEMLFLFPGRPSLSWIFARQLLIQSLFEAVGEGDVKLRPEDDAIVIELTGVSSPTSSERGLEYSTIIALPRVMIERYLSNSAGHDEFWRALRSEELLEETLLNLKI